MNRKLKKLLYAVLWGATGTGLLVLLLAAMNKRNAHACTGLEINKENKDQLVFISDREIQNLLTGNGQHAIAGRAISSFDLGTMEAQLKRNPWVKDAQLYFDNNEKLRVRVTEREPVARIFTHGGNSFYIDSAGAQLPLVSGHVLRLITFTNYPQEKMRFAGADSLLARQVQQLARVISTDSFWSSAIQQVDITPQKTFILIPVVGNHIIEFGDAINAERKLHRLYVFYRQVLTKTGFDFYPKINVQYEGEVIGVKKAGMLNRYDSVQAVKNIQQLIRQAEQLQADTSYMNHTAPLEHNTITEQNLEGYDLPDSGSNILSEASAGASTVVKPQAVKATNSVRPKPKAVMHKR